MSSDAPASRELPSLGLPLSATNNDRVQRSLATLDGTAIPDHAADDHSTLASRVPSASELRDDIATNLPAFPGVSGVPRSAGVSAHNQGTSRYPNSPYNEKNDNYPLESPSEAIAHRSSEVGQLARQMSRQSQLSRTASRQQGVVPRISKQLSRRDSVAVPSDNLFEYEEGGELDPFSGNFNARKYTRSLAALSGGADRKSGISYRNLSVHGFGSDAGESVKMPKRVV